MNSIIKLLILLAFLGFLIKKTSNETPKIKPQNYKKVRSFTKEKRTHKKYTNQIEAMWDEVNK